jgi:preprotein translocase subunit SecF
MAKLSKLTSRLYTGEISYDFIGRRRRWYLLSAILLTLSILAILARGLVFGIEFRGGADFKAPAQVTAQTVDQVREAVVATGLPDLDDAIINTIGDNQVRVQTRTLNPTTEVPVVRAAIAEEVGVAPDQVAYNLIGASWGSQITERGLIALAVFLALVALVIWVYFRDGKMAGAALVALAHDLLLTIGIYALVGFTVTPATLIGLLTILGYSLYDTVVVFDKVRENVRDIRSSTTRTYSEAANLAVNQVLVRSVNTTVIGVLPVAALLFAGAVILGEGPLKDLALALFVGMISGAYSSIFIATPLLAQAKEREPDMKKLAARVMARRTKTEQKVRPTGRTPDAAPQPEGNLEPEPTDVEPSNGEPSNAELAEAAVPARSGSTAMRITAVSTADRPPGVRPMGDAAAKRPQPQHKPRSQRKK